LEQDVSAEPSRVEEAGDFSSMENEEEDANNGVEDAGDEEPDNDSFAPEDQNEEEEEEEEEDANDEAEDADDEEPDNDSFVQQDHNEEDGDDVDDEMEDMDEQEDTGDEQDAVESSFLDGKLDDVASGGKCSKKDQNVLKKHKGNGKNSQGYHSAKCGRSSYSIFSGMDKKAFSTCLRGKVKISSGCGGCYASMADWSSKNCKMACISSWCSSGCLKCTNKNLKALDKCTGFTAYKVQSC